MCARACACVFWDIDLLVSMLICEFRVDMESFLAIIVDGVSCKMELNLSFLGVIWTTLEPFLDARGGLWKSPGNAFSHLIKSWGVESSLGVIFNKFCNFFGAQNDAKSYSWQASKNEVAFGTDLNDLFEEIWLEKKVFWSANLYLCWVWCEVHDNLRNCYRLL